MELPLVDVRLWGYDASAGGIGSPDDFQIVDVDHFDGPNQAAFTSGSPPYLDTDDAGDSYLYSKFPWNVAALFGPSAGPPSNLTIRATLQIPAFGFINTHLYLFDTATAAAGIGGAIDDIFVFAEGDAGAWVSVDLPADAAATASAVSGGRLGVAFAPGLRVTWVSVTAEGGPRPLRQRQRDDGLGMTGTPRWRGGTSRQSSNRWRGYL